jgi:4-amino-4-deoxy-L-arabinose transferase-like glycosyltransferase
MGLLRVLRPAPLSDTSLPHSPLPPPLLQPAPPASPTPKIGTPLPPPPAGSVLTRRELWVLLALTTFGGILRFAFLERPTLWIDEGFTYWRVSGTYRELVDILRDGGFTPLHYQAVWVLGRFTSLSPFFLRLAPAVCGTLMVPAMYFLARQLVERRTALLVAAFAACSAYLLNYSRDAKMYMQCWLFAALHVGCLLWWLRTRKTAAWLGWVAAGLGMVGTQAVSLFLLAIEPVLLLSAPRLKWWTTLIFLGGLAVVAAGPVGYYKGFNQWGKNIEKTGWNRASGLGWVDWYNSGRHGWDYLRYPATAFLCNWEWSKPRDEGTIDPGALMLLKTSTTALAVVLVLGLFPWTSLAPPTSRAATESPQPWWRTALWLMAWVVLPSWIFHATSADRAVSPTEWPAALRNAAGPGTGVVVIVAGVVLLAAFSCAGATMRQRVVKTVTVAALIAGVFLACLVVTELFDLRVGSVWVPRYLAVVWPAMAVAACALIMRLPGRPLRVVAVALLLGLNLANFAARLIYPTEAPLDRVAADVVAAKRDEAPVRTFLGYAAATAAPLSGSALDVAGRYYLCQAAGLRLRPGEFLAGNFDFRPDGFLKASGVKLLAGTSPWSVKKELDAAPHVNRVVLWDKFNQKVPPEEEAGVVSDAALLEAMGPGWKRAGEKWYHVYVNVNWQWRYAYRRREYVRSETP